MLFFFNDTATTEIYTLSLHDALPISNPSAAWLGACAMENSSDTLYLTPLFAPGVTFQDRKSTRLNSSHSSISYAVFCLKKKKHWSSMQSTNMRLSSLTLAVRT